MTKLSKAIKLIALTLVAAVVASLPLAGSAEATAAIYKDFDPGNIINDYTMGNYQTMSESQIQKWLTSKNPCTDTNTAKVKGYTGYKWHIENGHFVCLSEEEFLVSTGLPDYNNTGGETKTAAEIIYEASVTYKINPQVLLVLLQKEQGLITDTYPNNIQYRSATGYGCPDTAACSSKYYGFINQIHQAAAMFRSVLDGGWSNYPIGTNKIKYHPNASCGTKSVNIKNAATSVLYRYTPYVPNSAALNTATGKGNSCSSYGNRNFYYYFVTWFGSTQSSFKPSSVSQTYIQEGVYRLDNSSTGLSLSATGSSSLSLSNQSSYLSQKFQLLRVSGGYRIQEVNSKKYLDVENASIISGATVTLNDLDSSACSQKWLLQMAGGKFYLRSYCSGNALTANGSTVTANNYADSTVQKFELVRLSGSAPIADGTYSIVSHLGKAITPKDGNTENNALAAIWNKSGGVIQSYDVVHEKSGFYRFKDKKTGKYLGVKGASSSAGASVIYYDSTGTCAQRWIVKNQGTYYQLLSACSGKSLDAPAAKIGTSGTTLTIQAAATDNGQRWNFAPATFTELTDGEYHNILTTSGLALTIKGASTKNAAKIVLAENNNTNAQKFRFTKTSDGYYTIVNANKKLVYVPNNNNAVKVQQYSNLKSCNQKWWIIYNPDKSYSIRSACWTNRALGVAHHAVSTPGEYIISYSFIDDVAERFTIK